MSNYIPFYKEAELIGQASLEMKFPDKRLVRYLTFAKRRLRKAINICQKDIAAGIFCVLTESDTHFSIWREQSSEHQTFRTETPPKFQSQLHKTQPSNANKSNANKSNANKKDISSHIEVLESLYEGSLPLSEGNHTAETPQILATQVLAADSCVQSKVLNHKPALVAAKNTPSRTPSKTFKTFSTPRSAFLARLNLELTQHIGSKADYLINKLLSERPNIEPQQMIEAIAAEIPHMDESENILASLNRLNYYYSAN